MSVNFSGIPYISVLGKILRFPLRLIPKGMVIPIMQGRLRGKRWVVGSSNHGCWLGSYELSKQQIFAKVVQPGWKVFDVGAHVGYYSLLASVLVGPSGKVCSFEPSPQNLVSLKKHLKINDCANVVVVEAAVSDYCGRTSFDESRGSYTRRLTLNGSLEVRVLTLDTFVRHKGILADCIKIDVEGAEYQVLLGAKQLLVDHHPIIFLATHGRDIHTQCCRFLSELEYCIEPLPGRQGRTVETTDEILAYA